MYICFHLHKRLKSRSIFIHREKDPCGLFLLEPFPKNFEDHAPRTVTKMFSKPPPPRFSPSSSAKYDIWRSGTTDNGSSPSAIFSPPTAKTNRWKHSVNILPDNTGDQSFRNSRLQWAERLYNDTVREYIGRLANVGLRMRFRTALYPFAHLFTVPRNLYPGGTEAASSISASWNLLNDYSVMILPTARPGCCSL